MITTPLTHNQAETYAARIQSHLNKPTAGDPGPDRFRTSTGISITHQEEKHHVHIVDTWHQTQPITIGSFEQAEKMLRG